MQVGGAYRGTDENGIKISDAEMRTLNVTGDDFHPEWKTLRLELACMGNEGKIARIGWREAARKSVPRVATE